MITFDQIKQLLSLDIEGKYCFEIQFAVNGSEKFNFCWMGKLPDSKTAADVYWYGLTEDDENAYDFATFDEFANAKVFDGKSLLDVWKDVRVKSINSCDPLEMIELYLDGKDPFTGAPQ